MNQFKIFIRKNVLGKWFWILKAGNGKTLSHSEAYTSKNKCYKTAKIIGEKLKSKIVFLS